MTEEQDQTTDDLEQAEVDDVENRPDADGSNGDDNEDLQQALKDLAARMSVLQSNVENVKGTRDDLEDKLDKMESRMHRLGGLAEAVSSQYNPFLSENAPGEPTWDGDLDDDKLLTPVAPDDASPAGSRDETPGEPGGETAGASSDEPADAEASPPEEASAAPDELEREPEAGTPPEGEAQPEAQPGELTAEELEGMEALRTDVRDVAESTDRGRETPKDLGERLLLLEWVGMMMRRVGRAGLMDLMEYYEGLGWLDASTKNKALRVAVGIDAPDRVGEGGWRGDLDLHERSLMAIERLQGEEVTQAELEELQMDMRRLFDR